MSPSDTMASARDPFTTTLPIVALLTISTKMSGADVCVRVIVGTEIALPLLSFTVFAVVSITAPSGSARSSCWLVESASYASSAAANPLLGFTSLHRGWFALHPSGQA